jgi:hypothetical protein
MNKITIAIPYYEAPEMLRTQLRFWRGIVSNVVEFVNIVLIDDGSPNYPAKEVLENEQLPEIPISLYRIKENIPWNHAGARNLAFKSIKSGWVVSTDIDHVLPPESLYELLHVKLHPRDWYRPARYDYNRGNLAKTKVHTGTYIITREMFWEVGGFDERLIGYWNGPSYPFRRALMSKVKNVWQMDKVYMIRFNDTDVSDASVTQWGRNDSEYDIKNSPEMLKLQRKLLSKYKPKKQLQFTWEQVL